MKDLRHEAFRTSAPTACGEGSARPHSSPARGLDSVQLLATEELCCLVMSEPGWWVHERVILPARTKTHRRLAPAKAVGVERCLWVKLAVAGRAAD
jgi:hypothetical protein